MKKLHLSDRLSIPIDAVTQRISILGRTGTGKSYTAGVLVEEVLKAHQQVVIVDPKGDWWGLRSSADGKHEGLPITIMGGEHGDVPLEPTAGTLVADVVVNEGISVVIDLSLFESKAAEVRFAEAFFDRLYRKNRKPMLLVVDEADVFAPQRPERNENVMLNRIETICRRGRSKGIGVVLVSQRSASIHKGCLSQTELMIAHQTTSPQDREAIRLWVNGKGTEDQQKMFMDRVPHFGTGVAIAWSPSWLDVFKEIKTRSKETYDSSATPRVGMRRRAPKVLAKVDLDRLKSHMAATIEKMKQEDPKLLREEIRKLKEEIEAKEYFEAGRKMARGFIDHVDEIAKAPPKPKVVDKPVVLKKHLDRLHAILSKRATLATEFAHLNAQFGGEMLKLSEKIAADAKKVNEAVFAPSAQVAPIKPMKMKMTVGSSVVDTRILRGGSKHDGPVIPLNTIPAGLKIDRGEKRVLSALASFHPTAVSKRQLAVLCGIKAKGTTLSTYLSRHRCRGFINALNSDTFTLTQAGLTFIGKPEPMIAAQVREMWLGKFRKGPREILRLAIESFPNMVPLSVMAEKLQISEEGTTLSTYVSRLRSAGVITTGVNGTEGKFICASESLFEVTG